MSNWQDYLDPEIVEETWLKDRSRVYKELKDKFTLDFPPDYYAKAYWQKQISDLWNGGMDIKYFYDRTGRPTVTNLDLRTVYECCKEHLKDCLKRSPEFCDLLSREHLGFCINCHSQIIACESEEYCAKCYQQKLNNWRPL